MKNIKRLKCLEKCADKLCKPQFNQEFSIWLIEFPPEHISVNPNSYNDWLNTAPTHFKQNFEKWSANVRSYIQYIEKNIYCRSTHYSKV